jgi:hypothetical protein
MTTELKQLELDEVSLVDAGDDPLAKVAIFKRKKEEDMDKDEVIKDLGAELEALKVEKADLEAKATAADAKVEQLTKALEDATKEDVEKQEETIEVGGQKIAKSLLPEVVLKKLEEVEKAKEAEDLRKRANDTIPNFKGTADQRGKLMKAVGFDQELLSMLIAANTLFGDTYKEVGKSDADSDQKEASEILDEMVKSHQKTHAVDFYKAYEAVTKTAEGKALLLQTYKKK